MSLLTLVYRALCSVLAKFMFDECSANSSGIVVPGSAINSDLSASTSVIKSKTKKMLLDEQKQGCEITW